MRQALRASDATRSCSNDEASDGVRLDGGALEEEAAAGVKLFVGLLMPI